MSEWSRNWLYRVLLAAAWVLIILSVIFHAIEEVYGVAVLLLALTAREFAGFFAEYARTVQRQTKLNAAVNVALVSVVEILKLGWTRTGVSVFEPRMAKISGLRHLRRVAKIRIRVDLSDIENVRWTWGKGVVGQCWKHGHDRLEKNWQDEIVKINNKLGSLEGKWDSIPPDQRYCLSKMEFEASMRFGMVCVRAINDRRGKILAIVLFDFEVNGHPRDSELIQSSIDEATKVIAQTYGEMAVMRNDKSRNMQAATRAAEEVNADSALISKIAAIDSKMESEKPQ